MDKLTLTGKRILITGGAGFIGSHLVDRLVMEQPEKIVVVDNLFLGRPANLENAQSKLGVQLATYWQDATDLEVMRKIIDDEGIDVVYDMAVIPLPASLENPMWNIQQNVQLTTVLCELAREKRYQTLIHFSSSEAYGSALYKTIDENHPLVPSTPYAASKVAGDHIAMSYRETFGIDVATIRPFNNYGPRQNDAAYAGIIPIVAKRVQAGLPIEIFGDGEQTRDLIFVRDTAEAAVRIYKEPKSRGKVINVASGAEISINMLVQIMLKLMGIPDYPVHHTAQRPGDVRRHQGSIALAQAILDFTPKTNIEDGLRETIEWYRIR